MTPERNSQISSEEHGQEANLAGSARPEVARLTAAAATTKEEEPTMLIEGRGFVVKGVVKRRRKVFVLSCLKGKPSDQHEVQMRG